MDGSSLLKGLATDEWFEIWSACTIDEYTKASALVKEFLDSGSNPDR